MHIDILKTIKIERRTIVKRSVVIILLLCMCFSIVSCKTKPVDTELAQPNTEGAADNAQKEVSKDVIYDETNKNIGNNITDQSDEVLDEITDTEQTQPENSVDQTEQSTDEKQEKPGDTSSEISYDSFDLVETPTLKNSVMSATDIFIGEVIAAKELNEHITFDDFTTLTSIPVLYTVKVTKILKQHIVTDDSIIQVLHCIVDSKNNLPGEYSVNGYEIGKQYLIGGRVQPYKEKAIILDYSQLTARINEDGTIVSESDVAKKNFEGIFTISELVEHEEVKGLWENKQTDTATRFKDLIPTDEKKEFTEQDIIDYLKEAIKIDSDKVLKTPEASDE